MQKPCSECVGSSVVCSVYNVHVQYNNGGEISERR